MKGTKRFLKKAVACVTCVSLLTTNALTMTASADWEDEGLTLSLIESGNNAARGESSSNAKKSDTVTYEAYADGIVVTVEAPKGALPEEAELVAERLATGSDEFAKAAENVGRGADDENMAAVDIRFEADGEEVEPVKAVTVSLDVSEIMPENASPDTIEVTHLEENGKEKNLVIMANKKKGGIEGKGTASFSVKSFSVFTVTWDDDEDADSIEVHVYSVNKTSIDEELDEFGYSAESGTIDIEDLVSHLEQNEAYANTYTFRYATVVYETQMGQGYSSTTIGNADDSVTAVTKNGNTYTVTLGSGTQTVSGPDGIEIHLFYSIPAVSLETEDPHGEEVRFTTNAEYFLGDTDDAEYTWAVSDDSLGTLLHPTKGEAVFTWSDAAVSGDRVTVTVTMAVGDETASDTYTLTYGDRAGVITVYASDGTPQENARVALVDANGTTVATGTTDENGTVTLYAPAGTYTAGVTYVYLVSEMGGGSVSRATAEIEVIISDDAAASGSVTLGTAVVSGPGGGTVGSYGSGTEPYYYEHIDVKIASAETSTSDVRFSDLDAVYVYDKYGSLLYVSDDINGNPETTDYNILFDINGNEDTHSIVVSSEDTIVLVYEVYDNTEYEYKTYTATYKSGGAYPEDEYYPYTAINAYQLYNVLYGTDYASQSAFESAWGTGLSGYNEAGISITGYAYTLIADYLCDTRTTSGQAGLDFVIYVQDMTSAIETYDFRVAKRVKNVPANYTSDDIEDFGFTLQEIDKVRDDGDYTEAIWPVEDENVLSTDYGTISSFTFSEEDGTWNGVLDFSGAIQYEAEDGTNFYYYILSEDTPQTAVPTKQYYGIKVTVTYSAEAGYSSVAVSYCTLDTAEGYPYYRTSGWTGLTAYTDTDDEGEYTYYALPFTNTYSTTGFELIKTDEEGNPLDGAVFTMSTTQIESEGTELFFTSKTNEDGNVTYVLVSEDTEGASGYITVNGSVKLLGMAAGTYILTEVKAPEGYVLLEEPVTIVLSDNENVNIVTIANEAEPEPEDEEPEPEPEPDPEPDPEDEPEDKPEDEPEDEDEDKDEDEEPEDEPEPEDDTPDESTPDESAPDETVKDETPEDTDDTETEAETEVKTSSNATARTYSSSSRSTRGSSGSGSDDESISGSGSGSGGSVSGGIEKDETEDEDDREEKGLPVTGDTSFGRQFLMILFGMFLLAMSKKTKKVTE